MNHYAELTRVPFIGGGTVTICLEDISLLHDFGSDGVGIRMRDGYETECTESYAHVKALMQKAYETH